MALGMLLYAIWSSCFALGKMTLVFTTPLFLTSVRMLLASILLLSFLFLFKKNDLKISKNHFLPLVILGFFSVYLTNTLEFWGLPYLTASKSCFLYSLSPFFAAFFSYLHFGETMNSRKWLGMAIGFVGFLPVLLIQEQSEHFFKIFLIFSWPDLAIIGASIASVYGWVLLRMLVKNISLSPIMANGFSMLFGGLMALFHSLKVDNWIPIPITHGGAIPFLEGMLLMTFISNIICYNLYGYLLKKYTATFLSLMGLFSPIFASITGWMLLGEKFSPIIFLSSLFMMLGLWIVYKEELRQGQAIPLGTG